MLIPNRKKYKSVKSKPIVNNNKLINSLQLSCYKGYFPMQCNTMCPLHQSCWFYGLKIVKE